MSAKPYFTPEALRFLAELEQNNDRDWFQPRKEEYERLLKQPMLALAEDVQAELLRLAPAYATAPQRAVYRIYRDVRFSKNKDPYKTHAAALFWHDAVGKDDGAALYVAVSHKCVELAGGIYQPSAEAVRAIRTTLADNPTPLTKLLRKRELREHMGELQGESLQRPPRGFDANHPAIDLLRRKQWLLYRELPADLAHSAELWRELRLRLKLLLPVVEYFNGILLQVQQAKQKDPLRQDGIFF